MKIRHHEIEIDEENPFANCKLGRQKYAEVLTDIVGSYPEGFVLAINNEWGTGKTTFIRMWQQHLLNNDYKTIYFNAWENDFDLNPIVAIIAELKTLTERSTERLFKNVTEKGAALSKAVLPAVLKAATKRYFDTDEVTSAVEGVAKAAADAFDEEIKAYKKKKESITGFRDKLGAFVTKASSDKPIVFIIDELDRCRPDYAVEVLEQMKHFFTVPGMTFVLSMDKNHLAASVRGFYGSEQINTDEYLRRFIDLEYSIPKPSAEQFCKYLYEYYSFDDFFKSEERSKISELNSDGPNFLRMTSLLFQKSSSTLRQMEKIFGHTRLILNSFKPNQYTLSEALFVLVYLAVLRPDLYLKMKNGEISAQDLSDAYSALVPMDERLQHFLISTEARLLVLYGNETATSWTALLVKDDEGNLTTRIRSKQVPDGSNDLAEAMKYIYGHPVTRETKLSYLTNKIDLTENLTFQ